jgi:hypothetical protein
MTFATFLFFLLIPICSAQEVRLILQDEPARLLTASQQTVLRVLVTDGGGAPVPGEKVTFTAPPSGRAGRFAGDDGTAGDPVITVTSGADGIAIAILEAGTPIGPYYVYAKAEHGTRPAIFGVSNVPPRTPAPALAASVARKTLESKMPEGGVVYGPVWVPTVTTVVAAGPASLYAPSSSIVTSATGSWLFWVDADPNRLFGHAVQYVIIDASRTDPNLSSARFVRELWWPTVKISGASTAVQLQPWPEPAARDDAQPAACAIVAAFPSNPAAAANRKRVMDLWKPVFGDVRVAWNRASLQDALQAAAGRNCSTVYLHLTADGYPPRISRPNAASSSLGGILLAPTDLLDYTELAAALLALQDKPRVQLIIDAPYAGNAIAAFSGLGLAGDVLAGADQTSVQPILADGTPFTAELCRMWKAAIDAGKSFELAQMQTSSRVKSRYSRIVSDGPKVLPLPNLSFGGPGQIESVAIPVPQDFPTGATVSARITVGEPRIADMDPASGSAAPGKDLPPFRVFAVSPGQSNYTVQLSSGSGSPAYQGTGSIAVGQEVACSPARLQMTAGFSGEIRISPGAVYDPLFNGSQLNLRLLDERMGRLSTSQVTLHGDAETVRLTGFFAGSTTLEVTGARAWGQSYTACIVEVVVVPETGDGTLNTTMLIAQTDSSMQKVSTQLRVQSSTVESLASSGNVLCAAAYAPRYPGVGITLQSFGQVFQGKLDAEAYCFWPGSAGAPATIQFSTLFGGREVEVPVAVVPDPQGNVWLVGYTESSGLPVSATGRTYVAKKEVFVAKISRFGDKLLFSGYLGGSGDDIPTAAAIDPDGNLFITGYTLSPDYPVSRPVVQGAFTQGKESFITRLNGETGALMNSTLYGGNGDDVAYSIAVDAKGYPYIAGQTTSYDLAVTPGALQTFESDGPPCYQAGLGRPCPDAFVAKLSPDLSRVEYGTYLGGTNNDYAQAIAVDAAGNAIVVGGTSSADFPVTSGVVQPALRTATCSGFYPCPDAFVTILNPSGTALVASTFLGGDKIDEAMKVQVDRAGNVYVFGRTNSTNLAVTAGAFQRQYADGADAFLGALSPSLKSLLGLTYLGSTGDDSPGGLTVAPDGRVFFGINSTEKDLRVN